MIPKPERSGPVVPASGMSLYIHIPFCRTKCPYCDFNTYQGIESLFTPFLNALETELSLWGKVLGHPQVNTVFFGGGTPSYLPPESIKGILTAASEAFAIQPAAEITAEANPDDMDAATCAHLLEQGINRLSMGVQSLDNPLLTLLGRRHDAEQAIKAFSAARQAGFTNVNLDLMYGLPRQSLQSWQTTLSDLVDLGPEHISLYCLTLEEGTPLHQWAKQGKIPQPDTDLAADMYHHAEDLLAGLGCEHYEISNWCRPGFESQHNLAYWLNKPYLGVGPGAHSCLNHYRFWDCDSPRSYITRVEEWKASSPTRVESVDEEVLSGIGPIAGHEYIDEEVAASETLFLGLRLLEGMDLQKVSAKAGVDLKEKFKAEIEELLSLGLLEWSGSKLRLTKPAYLIANQVFTRFVN